MANRLLRPGAWSFDSAYAHPDCTGSCDQGRERCDCRPPYVLHPDLHRITCTELDLELGPDDQRVIAAPRPPLLTRTRRDRAHDVFKAVVALALLAFGLWVWPR